MSPAAPTAAVIPAAPIDGTPPAPEVNVVCRWAGCTGGAAAVVPVAAVGPYLVDGRRQAVFSTEERRHVAGGRSGLDRAAGRLAAKLAVLSLLGLPAHDQSLREVAVVAGGHEGRRSPELCRMGHRPLVQLGGSAAAEWAAHGVGDIAVSISHDAGVALALALATRRV